SVSRFLCSCLRRSLRSILFPYTTLFRSGISNASSSQLPPQQLLIRDGANNGGLGWTSTISGSTPWLSLSSGSGTTPKRKAKAWRDRKSTRLNSSHQIISYAVFCLKKKKI